MTTSQIYDVVIRGGTVYDGSGAPGVGADVAVRGDRIAAVGTIVERGVTELDAKGMAVAPGFIDVHSHDDFAVLLDPEMSCKVMQGVTTDVVGNCGSGVAPFPNGLRRFRRMHPEAAPRPWEGFAGYLARVEETRPSLNVAVLMGHGTLRAGAMENAQRPPRAGELDQMRAWVAEGVAAGAVGLSTGLIYEPGRYAQTDEIVALARVLGGATGGLYATHMRNEADALADAVREAIRIGEEAGVAVQISHHKASGRANWGRVRDSLRLIEEARSRGVDVTADQYPYTAGSTSLAAVIQNGAFRGDSPGGLGQLSTADVLIASAP
ncbi:MAG: N-acyl-D-amino-acid deacylase family protein, partial [Candidatus Rokuibacteriota bacterium]